mmetsp:Transcript_28775/g.58974  ORF Transcript_28775/g.58974 Transcript_28775/m.58974 type:complete len:301 (-) Transcript_28775:169-1071(-)
MRLLCVLLLQSLALGVPAACLTTYPHLNLERACSFAPQRCSGATLQHCGGACLAIQRLNLRGGIGDDGDKEEEAEEDKDQAGLDDESGEQADILTDDEIDELPEATAAVAAVGSSATDSAGISKGTVFWEFWKWREGNLRQSLFLEIGMITCPRAAFLVGPMWSKSLDALLQQKEIVSGLNGVFRFAVCAICPKSLLLRPLLKDRGRAGMAIAGLVVVHCIDDVMSLMTSPIQTLCSEALHAFGLLVLALGLSALPVDPLSSVYARFASFLLYLDWGALSFLVVSPVIRALSFLVLLFFR